MVAIENHRKKRADVAKHPQVLNHVGIPFAEPPGRAGLLLIKSSDDFESFAERSRKRLTQSNQRRFYYASTRASLKPVQSRMDAPFAGELPPSRTCAEGGTNRQR